MSVDLQNDLEQLLAKSRQLHAEARALDIEIARVARLILESDGPRQTAPPGALPSAVKLNGTSVKKPGS